MSGRHPLVSVGRGGEGPCVYISNHIACSTSMQQRTCTTALLVRAQQVCLHVCKTGMPTEKTERLTGIQKWFLQIGMLASVLQSSWQPAHLGYKPGSQSGHTLSRR